MEGTRQIVGQVIAGSPAYRAGVTLGDELIALDGHRIGSETLSLFSQGVTLGTAAELVLLRDDLLRRVTVTLDQTAPPEYVVRRIEDPSPTQRKTFEGWLGVPWPPHPK